MTVTFRKISTSDTIPPIELFSASIVGDGVADDSVAVKAAHDAAYAQGVRTVYCGKQYNVPTLTQCGNVIFVGEGRLIGAYRKQIVPVSAPRPYQFEAGIVPSRDFATLKASGARKLAFVGDSIGTRNANNLTGVGSISEEVFDRVGRAYTGTTFFNFSIPTMAWSNLASASPVSAGVRPAWYNGSLSWIAQVIAFAPDCIVIELGTNSGVTTVECPAVYDVISQLQSALPSCNVILCTPFLPSLQNPTWNTAFAQDNREAFAAFIRGVAVRLHLGLFDTGRMAGMLRDGVDPLREKLKVISTNFAMQTPYTSVTTTRDWYAKFQLSAAQVAFITTGRTLNFSIGAFTGHCLAVGRTAGGNFKVSILIPGASPGPINAIDTGVAIPASGTVYFEFLVKKNYVEFNYATVSPTAGLLTNVWKGYTERLCSLFAPDVRYSDTTSTAIFTNYLAVSEGKPIMPTMTDVELYGDYLSANSVYGGSGDVHPASDVVHLYSAILDNESVAA